MAENTESVMENNSEFVEYPANTVVDIPLSLIDIGENIRDADLDTEIDELGATIKEFGQIQPCPVYRKGDKYVLKCGSRRYKACLSIGLKTLKCIVEGEFKDEKERIIKQVIENEHRRNMSPREREDYLCRLSELGLSNAEIARALHKSRGEVSEAIIAHSKYMESRETFDKFPELSTREMYKLKDLPVEAISGIANEILSDSGLSKEEQKKRIVAKSAEFIERNRKNASSSEDIQKLEEEMAVYFLDSGDEKNIIAETSSGYDTGNSKQTIHLEYKIDSRKKIFTLISESKDFNEAESYVLKKLEEFYQAKGLEINE